MRGAERCTNGVVRIMQDCVFATASEQEKEKSARPGDRRSFSSSVHTGLARLVVTGAADVLTCSTLKELRRLRMQPPPNRLKQKMRRLSLIFQTQRVHERRGRRAKNRFGAPKTYLLRATLADALHPPALLEKNPSSCTRKALALHLLVLPASCNRRSQLPWVSLSLDGHTIPSCFEVLVPGRGSDIL